MILVPKVLIVPIVLVLIWSKIHFRLVFWPAKYVLMYLVLFNDVGVIVI